MMVFPMGLNQVKLILQVRNLQKNLCQLKENECEWMNLNILAMKSLLKMWKEWIRLKFLTPIVSNGSTLIGQSPARESAAKVCPVCKGVEGMRKKSGVFVEFDVNPKNGKKYAQFQKCKAYNDEIKNARKNGKVSYPNNPAKQFPMTCPTKIEASFTHLLQLVGFRREFGLNFF
jgi:hypothetical protein